MNSLPSESEFQRALVGGLRSFGAQVLNLNPNERMGYGWPDLFISSRLFNGWVELKTGKRELEVHQAQRMTLLNENDTKTCVLRLRGDFSLHIEHYSAQAILQSEWFLLRVRSLSVLRDKETVSFVLGQMNSYS
jgi:hypothetical protein